MCPYASGDTIVDPALSWAYGFRPLAHCFRANALYRGRCASPLLSNIRFSRLTSLGLERRVARLELFMRLGQLMELDGCVLDLRSQTGAFLLGIRALRAQVVDKVAAVRQFQGQPLGLQLGRIAAPGWFPSSGGWWCSRRCRPGG